MKNIEKNLIYHVDVDKNDVWEKCVQSVKSKKMNTCISDILKAAMKHV